MPRAEPRGRDGYTRASHNVGIIGPALGPHVQQTCLSMLFVYAELRCGISVSNHFAALGSSVGQELVGCPQHCCVVPNVSLAAARPLRGSLQSPGLRWRAQGKHQPSRRASGDRDGVLPRCRLRVGVHPGFAMTAARPASERRESDPPARSPSSWKCRLQRAECCRDNTRRRGPITALCASTSSSSQLRNEAFAVFGPSPMNPAQFGEVSPAPRSAVPRADHRGGAEADRVGAVEDRGFRCVGIKTIRV